MISCKSESNFIVKTTSSLLPTLIVPQAVQQDVQRLNLPTETDDHRQILDSAVWWCQSDFNEESKKEIESLLVEDNFRELTKRFKRRLRFNDESGVIQAKMGGGFSRVNFLTLQLLAHGIAEYMCENNDKNELANSGVVIGYDSRYDSQGFSQIMAAVFKAYGIRVYCLDRHAIAPFIAYFAYKFKCIFGVLVTGRDNSRHYNGVMIFNNKGNLITLQQGQCIEKSMNEYIKQQYYQVDLSPLFDYSSKKIKFKADNFTDVTMKSYIQDMEDKHLINKRALNKLCPRIIFSSLHGPATDYMKKLFANFGLPNLSSTECQTQLSVDFGSVITPSVQLDNVILRHSKTYAEQRDSKFIIVTDPIGESLLAAELQEDDRWHIFSTQEIAILLIEHLISFGAIQNNTETVKYYVIQDREDPLLQAYCASLGEGLVQCSKTLIEGAKRLLGVNFHTSTFQFGQAGNDALNAAIILSQILVASRNDSNNLLTEYRDILQRRGLDNALIFNTYTQVLSLVESNSSYFDSTNQSWKKSIFTKLNEISENAQFEVHGNIFTVKAADLEGKQLVKVNIIDKNGQQAIIEYQILSKTICRAKIMSRGSEKWLNRIAFDVIRFAFQEINQFDQDKPLRKQSTQFQSTPPMPLIVLL